MKGKTVVVTGGTSGIGEVAAEKLAEMGARIVLVARDRSRGDGTLARLREKAPGLAHTVHYADLTRISEGSGSKVAAGIRARLSLFGTGSAAFASEAGFIASGSRRHHTALAKAADVAAMIAVAANTATTFIAQI